MSLSEGLGPPVTRSNSEETPSSPPRIAGSFDEQFFSIGPMPRGRLGFVRRWGALCLVLLLLLGLLFAMLLYLDVTKSDPPPDHEKQAREFADKLGLPVEAIYCAGSNCTLKFNDGTLTQIVCENAGCRLDRGE